MARMTRMWLQVVLLCVALAPSIHRVEGQTGAAINGKLPPNAKNTDNQRNWQEVRGANYVPSYARNATEVWTRFDAEILDRELGFAERLGFNTIRFFLDVRAYEADSTLMLDRLDQFLALCEKHHLRTIPQLFDSCGVEQAVLRAKGTKWFDPKTGRWLDRHWRTWTSNPGYDRMGPEHWGPLEQYVRAIVEGHLEDDRILLWDVVNEPWCMARWRNPEQRAVIARFTEHFCKFVKRLKPEAPITVGLTTLDRADMVEDWIDVVTFHMYQPEVAPQPKRWTATLSRARRYSQRIGKPILLTEFGHPAWFVEGGKGRSIGDEPQRAFYEQILPVVEQSKIGWCIFDLIMGYGPFAHISVLKPNGDKRPAAIVIEALLQERKALADWKKANRRLTTQWTEDVSPEAVLPEYPRPQMVRDDWLNLNGRWEYATRRRDTPQPDRFDGEILVPFPVESTLSGVGRRVTENDHLWYRRSFSVPAEWSGQRVLLHFGAVDWEAVVWVDGKRVGSHRGGYDPFAFDITDALTAASSHQVTIRVWDPSDRGKQPRGKQRQRSGGIWYTPSSGIWQTVWLEPVPPTSISTLKLTPNLEASLLELTVSTRGRREGHTIEAVALDGDREISRVTGRPGALLQLKVEQAKLWSPGSPFLYGLRVKLLKDAQQVDQVASYFGMRKISLGNDGGITRILLNNKPLFQIGPLDQGFWPDGLYTAPTDEALRYDLEIIKKLGFNMVRKHVKVEPDRWYYWCDKLGLLVWQDMPNGDEHAPWPRGGREIKRSLESDKQFRRELKAVIDSRYNHPSIVMWVPFNEAWGQFDTVGITNWVKQHDPSRLVNSASGGNDFGVGDVSDVHIYRTDPGAPPAEPDRAAVLGEFGGLGLSIEEHTWQEEKNWAFRTFRTRRELTDAYVDLIARLRPLIKSRLSAAVYTQTTDVEVEVDGLMTYDRSAIKVNVERVAAANRKLHAPFSPPDAAAQVAASTLAYWRFEDGKPGEPVPSIKAAPRAVGVRDVSGHHNHLYAFAPANAPNFGSDVPRPVVSSTGRPNRGSLDDTAAPPKKHIPTRDLYTAPARSRSRVKPLNSFPLRQWTVEASFKINRLGHTHGIVGKDGKPTSGPAAPLQLTVNGSDNRIEIQAIDRTGTVRHVRGRRAVEIGRWYHVAAVSDGKTLKLFVDQNDGQGYQQHGQSEFVGQLINSTGTWSVGRGFENGRIGRDARAIIDEVRISTTALSPAQFVFSPKSESPR